MSESAPTRRDAIAAGAAALATLHVSLADTGTTMKTHLPHARPEQIGLDAKQLQVAYDLLEKWTNGKDAPVPSGAILVGRNGKVVPPRYFGRMGPEPDSPAIRKDALFLMASITKPVTYLGAMLLVERGLLNLTDPVVRYVPEFKGGDKEQVLVRHLFTHTSGLPDMLPDDLKLRKARVPLQRFLDGAVKDTKLSFKPGSRISYQSMGTAIVAEIIQRLSGKPISEYLRREIFEPLGLKSIGLGSKGFARERLVRVETPDYQTDEKSNWNSEYWQELGAPWGGMFSSPEDFAVICQVMLAKGTWGEVRVLSPAGVRAMTTNRLLEEPNLPEAEARSKPWGLGWRMNHPGTPESWGDLLGKDVFGHTGATGTTAWIDPQTQGFCILLTNAVRSKAPWRLVHLSNAIAAAFV
jgi:CubicO group peptidase (beta-lactamase class C family)